MLTKEEKKTFKEVKKLIKDLGIQRVNYEITFYYYEYKKDFNGCNSLLIGFNKFRDCIYAIEYLTKDGLILESQYKKDGNYYLEYDLSFIDLCFKNKKDDDKILAKHVRKSNKKFIKKQGKKK